MNATQTEPIEESEQLIPSISLEALCTARDQMLEAYVRAGEILEAAHNRLRAFGIDPLRVGVDVGSQQYRDLEELLTDRHSRGELRLAVDMGAWRALFKGTSIDQIMDEETRSKLHESLYPRYGASDLPELTPENIRATFDGMHDKRGEYFATAVEGVFRRLSWDYKTNAPFKFGTRMIVSSMVDSYAFSLNGRTVSLCQRSSGLMDLERVLCILDKQPPPAHGSGLSSMREVERGEWVAVPPTGRRPLLRLKVFKNRNAHIEILVPSLVDDMNRIMSDRTPFSLGSGRKTV